MTIETKLIRLNEFFTNQELFKYTVMVGKGKYDLSRSLQYLERTVGSETAKGMEVGTIEEYFEAYQFDEGMERGI